MSVDLGPPATDETGAGLLVAEGLCPHCHDTLLPYAGYGWCIGCELGWRCRRSGPRTVEIAVSPDPLPFALAADGAGRL